MDELLSLDKLAHMSNAELTALAQKVRGRLKNEDWQQFVEDLQNSGHIHAFKSAPLLLQRYLWLKIDLDKELSKRSINAPLLSSLVLNPSNPRPTDQQLLATLSSQDNAASMELEIDPEADIINFSFTVKSMLTLRFNLPHLDMDERRIFIEKARRELGMAFLWTRERWDSDYLIFIRQEYFSRVYAFSRNIEATARITTQAMGDLMHWLEKCWFPRGKGGRTRRTQQVETVAQPLIPTASSTQPKRSEELRRMVEEWQLKQAREKPSEDKDSSLTW